MMASSDKKEAAVDKTTTALGIPPHSYSDELWNVPVGWLHDHHWLERGVAIVRPQDRVPPPAAKVFLLLPAECGVLCTDSVVDTIVSEARNQNLLRLDLSDPHSPRDRERMVTDRNGKLVGLRRQYRHSQRRKSIMVTPSRQVAEIWRTAMTPMDEYRQLLRQFSSRARLNVFADVFFPWMDRAQDICEWFLHTAGRPPILDADPKQELPGVWVGRRTQIDPAAMLVGPLWIGDDCVVTARAVVVGPKTILDGSIIDGLIVGHQAKLTASTPVLDRPAEVSDYCRSVMKRVFDVVTSLIVIAMTLPLYPPIMLAIAIEDGWPFFFKHERESLGGREFPCLKFRTMRKNAEKIKLDLQSANQADGPQFYISNDPRVTRVGRILRKTHLDELPQFFNVLLGQMSIVGPRPSPHRENQFCPEWRDARLSVRPGITGLWQMLRTREPGRDFQEWILFDIAYLERASFLLDTWIIAITLLRVLGIHVRKMPLWEIQGHPAEVASSPVEGFEIANHAV